MKKLMAHIHVIGIAGTILTTSCTATLGELPDFKIKKSDHTEVSVTQYIKGKPAMIIHFDADCKGCQDEAEAIVNNLDRIGGVQIVFTSLQGFDKIDLFDEYFKLSENKNIIVGQDYDSTIPTHFNTYTTPLIALVDDDRHVRKVILGQIEIGELTEFINEIN